MIVTVVGSSGGIGSQCVRRLSEKHSVLGIDQRDDPTGKVHAFLRLQLESEETCSKAMKFCNSSEYGLVDAIVFAAGSYRRLPISDYDFVDVSRTFWDNFYSVFFLCREILPQMVDRGSGKIILVSSQAAVTGGLDVAYASSKGALQSFMKSIAREYGPLGITCNSVSPGPVDTEMAEVMGDERKRHYIDLIPSGSLAVADDVAGVVEFLLERDSNSINGATFDVDGGLVRR